MSNDYVAVAEAVGRVRRLLLDYGDEFTTPRLSGLESRLRAGDRTAVVSAVSEATGGMGSLADRYLCRENGDQIRNGDVYSVNKRLTDLVKEVEASARLAAAKNGIHLAR